MSNPDDLVPRDEVVERIEALAEAPHLAEEYQPGSEGETAYVHAAHDAAKVVEQWPDDE